MKTNYTNKWALPRKPYEVCLANWRYKGKNCHKERKKAHGKYVRAKRNENNLPNSWNDIAPSRVTATSWKDKTKMKKQWQTQNP